MANKATNNVTPISADSQLSDAEKREQLRARIAAGERRNTERSFADQAKDVADSAVDFAKKHPIATVAGAVAVGLAIGAMTRRGRALGRRGGSLAAYAAEAAIAYGLSMMESAGDKFEDYSDAASTQARRLKRDAGYRLDSIGDAIASGSRKASRKSSRTVRDLKARITR